MQRFQNEFVSYQFETAISGKQIPVRPSVEDACYIYSGFYTAFRSIRVHSLIFSRSASRISTFQFPFKGRFAVDENLSDHQKARSSMLSVFEFLLSIQQKKFTLNKLLMKIQELQKILLVLVLKIISILINLVFDPLFCSYFHLYLLT